MKWKDNYATCKTCPYGVFFPEAWHVACHHGTSATRMQVRDMDEDVDVHLPLLVFPDNWCSYHPDRVLIEE